MVVDAMVVVVVTGDDVGGGGGGYHIHQSVSAVHSAGEALSSLSGHNVDKLKQ